MVLADAAEILDAARGYVWIALAALVLWRLFPILKQRLEHDDISVEVDGKKLSVQNVSTQLHQELDDLRKRVIALGTSVADSAVEPPTEAEPAPPEARSSDRVRILWVDDRPENNAFLISSLRTNDAEVVEVLSTEEALAALADPRRFHAVVSDMVRRESGVVRPLAGVELVRRMQDRNITVPVVIYASPKAVARGGTAAVEAGAVTATASPTELLSLLRVAPTTALEASVADVLRRHVGATPFPIHGVVDYVIERDGRRTGVEIKNWSLPPARERAQLTLQKLDEARGRFGFDEILVVTAPGMTLPDGVDVPDGVRIEDLDELVAEVSAPR